MSIMFLFWMAAIIIFLTLVQLLLAAYLLIDIKIEEIREKRRIKKENKIYKNIVDRMSFN